MTADNAEPCQVGARWGEQPFLSFRVSVKRDHLTCCPVLIQPRPRHVVWGVGWGVGSGTQDMDGRVICSTYAGDESQELEWQHC